MERRLRFTGEWPPVVLWEQYPNWEYALDEEGEEGQDETTIRPAGNQSVIDESIDYTAATATLPDGTSLPTFLVVYHDPESCESVAVFINSTEAWQLGRDYSSRRWSPFEQTWLPEEERSPVVSLDDPDIFPLKVESRLSREATGKPFSFVVLSSGETEETDQ